MARQGRFWLSAVVSAALLAGVAAAGIPAAAQERGRDERARGPDGGEQRDRERYGERRHERRDRFAHERREALPAYGYGVPTYVPDPPPVIYAPPAPVGGLSFFFNFR
jgi:hypothetical protein